MHKLKRLFIGERAMVQGNLDTWLRSPRTILMAVFVMAECYLQAHSYGMMLDARKLTMHYGETMFYALNRGCNMPLTSIVFLMMVSEIPRRIPFQHYALIRCSRAMWLLGQIIYCLLTVIFMLVLIILCFSLFCVPFVTHGTGWSDITRLAEGMDIRETLIPGYILQGGFTPLSASLAAILPLFFFWFTMVLVILFFSLLEAPMIGIATYAFLLLANVSILYEVIPGFRTPIHFATLDNITSAVFEKKMVFFARVIAIYAIIDLALIALMTWQVRRTELNFYAANQM